MEGFVETNVDPRKEWAAPELKKVDIEEITAKDLHQGYDRTGLHNS